MQEPDALANESWFNSRWRPAMAWLWFTVSACDFILFPVLNAVAAGAKLIPYQAWQPLTLQGGGLFHIAMGAVVGVAVWQRTQEKMAIYGAAGFGGGYRSPSRGFGAMGEPVDDQPSSPSQRSSRAD